MYIRKNLSQTVPAKFEKKAEDDQPYWTDEMILSPIHSFGRIMTVVQHTIDTHLANLGFVHVWMAKLPPVCL